MRPSPLTATVVPVAPSSVGARITRSSPNYGFYVLLAVLRSLALPAQLAATLLVLRARRNVAGTTLTAAWWWSLVGLAGWWLGTAVDLGGLEKAAHDRIWYATAVISLCPLVQILGARRPVSRSWTGFVVLPMLAVLGLPIATSVGTPGATAFEIDTPPLLGYLLVLVMGAGNYFGTRFTGPVLLIAVALASLVVSGSTSRPDWFLEPDLVRPLATILLGLGVVGCARRSRSPDVEDDLERAWIEFRDLFGIVWAKRVMDRVNESLETAGLKSRLDLDGWQPDDALDPADREAARRIVRETFSWLLKRFVDEAWAGRFGIELRGGPTP